MHGVYYVFITCKYMDISCRLVHVAHTMSKLYSSKTPLTEQEIHFTAHLPL